LAFAKRLLLYTGQRGSDVVRMEWKHFDGEYILVRQKKTENQIDQLLSIPCHEVLRAELMSMPRRGKYILLGERGDRLQAKSLSIMLSRALALMGGKGYSMHGLRKNAAKALAEAGCTDAQIMAITGHRTNEMIRLYTKGAEQKRLARSAMDQLQAKSS
jgi:integrase